VHDHLHRSPICGEAGILGFQIRPVADGDGAPEGARKALASTRSMTSGGSGLAE